MKMGPRGCIEMSVRNYHYTLRNIPGQRRSNVLRGGSLKSSKVIHLCCGLGKWRPSLCHKN
jgi:hypothetical protein